MGARSTKLSKGVSTLTLGGGVGIHDKYLSTLSLNTVSASEWNLVVKDSFNPEAVGLPSSQPQTKHIGPKPIFMNFETIRRPKAISQQLAEHTKTQQKQSSPSHKQNTQQPTTSGNPASRKSSPAKTKQIKSEPSGKANEPSSSNQSHKYNLIQADENTNGQNGKIGNERLISSSSPAAELDAQIGVQKQSFIYRLSSAEGSYDVKTSAKMIGTASQDEVEKYLESSFHSDSDTDTETGLPGTTKSLTGSEKATLRLLEEGLNVFDDTELVQPERDAYEETDPPEEIFSNPDYDMSDEDEDDDYNSTPNKYQNQSPIKIVPTLPLSANKPFEGIVKPDTSEPYEVVMGQVVDLHEIIDIDSRTKIVEKKSVQQVKGDLKNSEFIPPPDYDSALQTSRYVNSVMSIVEENVNKSSEQSFDSPTAFILPAAEKYQPRLAKQIAYVKPNIKEPRQIPAPDYDETDGSLSLLSGKNSARIMSMVVETPSYIAGKNHGRIDPNRHSVVPGIREDMSPSVRNMVKRFESVTPQDSDRPNQVSQKTENYTDSPLSANRNSAVVNTPTPRQPSWVH